MSHSSKPEVQHPEVHHSMGLNQKVLCDGSRFGRQVIKIKEKWRVPKFQGNRSQENDKQT